MTWREEVELGWRALLGLVLPSICPSCGGPSFPDRDPWCQDCAPTRDCLIVHPRPRPQRMPYTVAAGEYSGPLRDAVLAYKDGAHRDLARDLAGMLTAAVLAAGWEDAVAIVAIPSSRGALRRRGFDHTAVLARHVARALEDAILAPIIARPGDDRRLRRDALERRVRVYSLTHAAASGDFTQRPIILLDDVATSGWTLAAAAAALEDSGYEVRGAAVVAAAVLRGSGAIG